MKMKRRLSRANAREIRGGIKDARRGASRPWDPGTPKQGPYWDAHYRTTRRIVRKSEPRYLQGDRLSHELDRLDDRICDILSGDVPPESLPTYLTRWIDDFRDIREHYGLDNN